MASGRVRIGCRCRNTLFMTASDRCRTDEGHPLRTIEPETSCQVLLPSAPAESMPLCMRPGNLFFTSPGLGNLGTLLAVERAIRSPPLLHQPGYGQRRCGR